MGLAIDVSTRLWMAGVVSLQRDTLLADHLLRQVRTCCQGEGINLPGTITVLDQSHVFKYVLTGRTKKRDSVCCSSCGLTGGTKGARGNLSMTKTVCKRRF